jgi:hypothetical protein
VPVHQRTTEGAARDAVQVVDTHFIEIVRTASAEAS